MTRAVIFDLDGTLIHSTPDIHAAVAALLEEEGQAPLDLATIQSFVGNGLPKLVERVITATGLDAGQLNALTERVLSHYIRENGKRTTIYPGVRKCLLELSAKGLALGICTNKPEAPARHILDHLGLGDFFSVVAGGDTYLVKKPDPEPLINTMEALGADPVGTLYVGDSEVDAATAKAANLPFALYTEGYRKSPVESFEAVLTFDDYADLTRLALAT